MLVSQKQYIALAAALQMSVGTSAQNLKEQVWSVFAYNLHGDSIPVALPQPRALTPYGANDMYAAGAAFRNRYVAVHSDTANASTRIPSLSPYLLESEDISIISTTDQPVVASAQAFMQGLYPPLEETYDGVYSDPSFQLANGSMATAPMNGYQYAQVLTLSPADPRSILLDGQAECTLHQVADSEYHFSTEVEDINQKSEAFYGRLHSQALKGVFDLSSAKYSNAYSISEFLEYQLLHNKTLLHHLHREDIELARWYADHYMYATNGKTSSPGTIGSNKIRTVAGRTLASYIIEAFDKSIDVRGAEDKMTLLFGASEPAVALASLMQVASSNQEMFYPRPDLGASLVFELYSLETEAYPTYPEASQLYVRFLLRNGTDSSTEFQSYPLFGHGPSNDAIPYSEFRAQMREFSLGSIKQWCLECSSSAVFCSGVMGQAKKTPASKKGINPAVAGVIGAVITIVTLALIAIVVFLLFDIRMKRMRTSGLGGFKGNNKMASDSDVTFKNTTREDVKTAEDSHSGSPGIIGAVIHGHERTGSWEMRNQQEGALTTSTGVQEAVSPFDDEHDDVWRRHSIIEPVKAREHI